MNFASPPAIYSPISYPPSPESTRQEYPPAFPSPKSALPAPTDYSQALASDPFTVETSDDEDDSAIQQALENARTNNEIATARPIPIQPSGEAAVKETFGRFASAPRRLPTGGPAIDARYQTGVSKSAIDVDAFKRMLLTGDRGSSSSRELAVQNNQSGLVPVSDSGSSADTASISQHSLFETVTSAHEESPRTSDEFDGNEANTYRASLGTISEKDEKPAPPHRRRGKPLKDAEIGKGPRTGFDKFMNSLSFPASHNVSSDNPSLQSPPYHENSTFDRLITSEAPDAQKKLPPALPQARRKSQQASTLPVLTRSSSSRQSVFSDIEGPPSPSTAHSTSKPPPPPPVRRANTNDRRHSIDIASIPKDADVEYSKPRPGLPQTPSYLKRMSPGLPPPVPPPRRGRGSSRSSVESPRPSVASLGPGESGESASSTPKNDPSDILADLAALQREISAARAGAGR